jgi:hypothetical protein
MPQDLYLKIPGFALDSGDIGQCEQFDIQVPVDLDQFGGDDSHGAVIGGKGLVKSGHGPADGRPLFQKVYVVSGTGQIKGALHAGNSRARHHHSSCYTVRHEISP